MGELELERVPSATRRKGLRVPRRFTTPGISPYSMVAWTRRGSKIAEPDGRVVFEMKGIEVPESWSQLATDIAASKYFRKAGVPTSEGHETSVRQLVHRVAHTIRRHGESEGYFASPEDAVAFEDELAYMLVTQRGAFNSPVWFNCGLYHEYGIEGQGGSHRLDPATGQVETTSTAYEHPQCSACFIQTVTDDLMSIFELVKNEAKLFKYGSGTGTNFSRIRGRTEPLSGGGISSGLMSFLKVLDAGAGSIKSGGTTRRAAKMVCLDMDHPEIEEFIDWKMREEAKAKLLIEKGGFEADFNGEAYQTVSGQNSNNSVRVTDAFMQAVLSDGEWTTKLRTTGEVHKRYKARDLMRRVAEGAWACADPGVQYDTIINDWHTVPNTDRIYASNPCVTGDTFVATSIGYRRIADLVGKEADVSGSDGREHPTTRVIKTGTKPVFELRTKGGYTLRLTADHRVFTLNRGDVPASELAPDDVVALGQPGFGSDFLPVEAAELLGAALGDGCIGGDQRHLFVTLGKSEAGVAEDLRATVDSLKIALAADGRGMQATTLVETPTTLRVGTSSAGVVGLFERYAVLDAGSENKQLRDAAFGLDRESVAAVLRGLFTTDGTVADYGEKSQYVALDSTSLALLRQVQLLLLGFGIKAKLYEDRLTRETATLPDGKGGTKEYAVRQMHSLRVSRASRVLFEREIGFHAESGKAAKLRRVNARVGTYREELTDAVARLTPAGVEDVYDLTEPVTDHFVANGIVVHNCSEYMHLDDSACNLASLNIMRFARDDGSLDLDAYKHAVRVFFIAQEIVVGLASYPTAPVAKNSHDYRPLGLGYANLGTWLMVNGIPYDSEEGRAWAACVTAIMTGHAYEVSADMASAIGPFAGFAKNREPMLRVMGKHRDAAYQIPDRYAPRDLIAEARASWDRAVREGEAHGYRNSQATVIAPTGTIGLLMDCDTTGVEPEFSIVKWKKLAGGGYFKIVNQSISRALGKLAYTETQVQDIERHVLGHGALRGAPHVSPEKLKALGFHEMHIAEALAHVEKTRNLDDWTPHVNPKTLREKGLSEEQIEEAQIFVGGAQTVEGAPHLRSEHYAVFDCANKCGLGKRYIDPMGHVRLMGAVQPFISGAISKTVNLPAEATVEEIERIYVEGWRLGLKAIALYRDGCKASQPLNTANAKSAKRDARDEATRATGTPPTTQTKFPPAVPAGPAASAAPAGPAVSAVPAASAVREPLIVGLPRGYRKELPPKRKGYTVEASVGGHKIFLRTGEYDDQTLGEIFIDMYKEGAAYRSLVNCFAIAVSIGLQYGVPLEKYVNSFTFTRFQPSGMTDHPNIRTATSMLDFVFRVLGMEYLGRTDFVHVKPPVLDGTHVIENGIQGAGAAAPSLAPPSPLGAATVAKEKPLTEFGPPGEPDAGLTGMNRDLAEFMGDAPMCDICGHVTVRNGACYKCLNCGNSMGCS